MINFRYSTFGFRRDIVINLNKSDRSLDSG